MLLLLILGLGLEEGAADLDEHMSGVPGRGSSAPWRHRRRGLCLRSVAFAGRLGFLERGRRGGSDRGLCCSSGYASRERGRGRRRWSGGRGWEVGGGWLWLGESREEKQERGAAKEAIGDFFLSSS